MEYPLTRQLRSGSADVGRFRFNVIFSIIIISLFAGGLGGSFQPARVIISLAIVYTAMTGLRFGPESRVFSRGLALAAVFILFGTVSLAWTSDVYGGVGLIFAVALGLGSIVVAGNMDRSVKGIAWIIWAWTIVTALTVPMAFYEIVTGNHFAYALETRNLGGDLGEFPFASGFFGNYNDYSVFLCMGYPFVCSALMITRYRLYKILMLIIIFSIFFIVLANTSRAAIAFLTIYTSLLFIFFARFRNTFLFPTTILIILVAYRYYDDLFQIIWLITFRIESTNALDESTIQRIGIFWAGVEAVRTSYGLSVGVGGFDEFMSDYYSYYVPNTHNIFLEIAVNFGVLTLIGFVLWLGTIFVLALRRSDLPIEIRLQVLFCLSMIPVIGIIGSQAIGYVYWWVWLVSLGVLASAWTSTTMATVAGTAR